MFACRAWASFGWNGTALTIRGSGNVSSITRVSAGVYTINFSTNMPDANYAIMGFTSDNNNTGDPLVVQRWTTDGYTASSVTIRSSNGSGGDADSTLINIAVFR